jgi:hypothetical protein
LRQFGLLFLLASVGLFIYNPPQNQSGGAMIFVAGSKK